MPNFASDGSETILDNKKGKCYAIAEEIIHKWTDKPKEERTVRPRAVTAVEKLAFKHMEIVHVVVSEPKEKESDILDSNYLDKKREAILTQIKPFKITQVQPNSIFDKKIVVLGNKVEGKE